MIEFVLVEEAIKLHEEHKRSALKSLSFRIIASATGMILLFIFTGEWGLVAGFGIGDFASKLIIYYVHERFWDKVSYGRKIVTIESFIRNPPVTALPTENVKSIIGKMIANDICSVVIKEKNTILGVVTESDILVRVLGANRNPSDIFVDEIMSSPVVMVEYDKSFEHMLNIMREKKVRRLIVNKEGSLAGAVTERRVLEALI